MPRRPSRARRRRTAQLIGAAVAFIGGLALVAWYARTLDLVSVPESRAPMSGLAAAGFIITGLAVFAHARGHRRVAFWGGALAAGAGSILLAGEVLRHSFGLTGLLAGQPSGADTSPASPLTALCLALAGCLLIAVRSRGVRREWRRGLCLTLAALLVASGFVGLVGWSLGSSSWIGSTGMGAFTAFGFLGLGISFYVMFSRYPILRERPPLPRWAPFAIGSAVALLSVSLWVNLSASEGRLRTLASQHAHEATVAYANVSLRTHLTALERFARRLQRPRFASEAEMYMADVGGLVAVAVLDGHDRTRLIRGPASAIDLQNPQLALTLARARRDGSTAVSDPARGEDGVLKAWVAIPSSDGDPVVFAHDLEALLESIFLGEHNRMFSVELAVGEASPFYRSFDPYADPERRLSEIEGGLMASGHILFGNRLWTLRTSTNAASVFAAREQANTLLLWVGCFLGVAIAFLVRRNEQVRNRATSLEEAKQLIEQNARSLRAANLSLEMRAAELESADLQLRAAAAEKRRVLDSLSAFIIGVDAEGQVTEWNRVSRDLMGIDGRVAVGRRFGEIDIGWSRRAVQQAVEECRMRGRRVRVEDLALASPDEGKRIVSLTVNPTDDVRGQRGFAIIGADVTERRELEVQLQQAQRLEAVGTLAAGMAHEINTPMQYVSDNLNFVTQNLAPIIELLELAPEASDALSEVGGQGGLAERVAAVAARVDAAFVAAELPMALKETRDGVDRVTTIVRAMKDFSHPGSQGLKAADINHALRSTLTVARNETKYVADVETEFGELPRIECWIAELNQVFLNLVVNAAQAIREKNRGHPEARGRISVRTRELDGEIEIRIADTGGGIPPDIQERVFDQFFTTKEPGQGTGLGLAMARSVVVDKHQGSLTFETTPNEGTTFIVRLPAGEPEKPGAEAHLPTSGCR